MCIAAEHLTHRNSRKACGVIGQAVRDDQFAVMEQSAAGVNDIGHVAFPLILVGLKQRFTEAADYFARIIAIQQERTNAVFPHRTNSVAEYQPAGIRLDRRSAVAKLNQLLQANSGLRST